MGDVAVVGIPDEKWGEQVAAFVRLAPGQQASGDELHRFVRERLALLAAYFAIYANFRIAELPAERVWTWLVCFVAVDFGYYWFHRLSHEINFLWAAHVVHNHGGTFIVWDRLFGTFEREVEPVVYGMTKPLASWNPFWANLHSWVELFHTARRTRRPIDKLLTFLKPPGWFPAD